MSKQYPDKDDHGNLRTPYAVRCHGWEKDDPEAHGLVYLTEAQYNKQMQRDESMWACPLCGIKPASWEDENFDEMLQESD